MANQSAKITWFVTVMALFIIGGMQSFREGGKTNILLVIAMLSVSLILLLERYYLAKANEDNTFRKTIAATLVLIVLLLGIAFLF